jgi:putative membrane protein
MQVTKEDRDAVAAAIRDAEQKTSGQIVCVLARASSTYSYVPALWAAVLALLVPWPLVLFTPLSAQRIFLIQSAVFIVVAATLLWPPLRLALVPRAVKRTRAHRAAVEQFFARGVSRTAGRTGVLIFVSLAEHYARIVADTGIAAKVPNAAWQRAIDALTEHMREGRVGTGFVAAIERCGDVLAAHAPPAGRTDQLPDRLYVI